MGFGDWEDRGVCFAPNAVFVYNSKMLRLQGRFLLIRQMVVFLPPLASEKKPSLDLSENHVLVEDHQTDYVYLI